MRSLTGNPLAFGLTAAILLTLLFRAGVRQRGETVWAGSEASMADAIEFMRNSAQGWKVPAQTTAAAIAETEEVLAFFAKVHPIDAGGELRLSFNGLDFGVAVVCHGGQHPVLAAPAPAPALPRRDIENEESAAFSGLRDFLQSLVADRKSAEQLDGRMRVSLVYAV